MRILRFLFLIAFIGGLNLSINAQELGIRFGDVLSNDVAVDGVFSLGKFSRIHANVSFGNEFAVEALYDFLYRPLGNEDGLYWYVGAGPALVFSDPFFLGVAGEVGMEYRFGSAPIALGIDWRPTFFLIENTDFEGGFWGINARYVFNK